jgi:hypothetical protein
MSFHLILSLFSLVQLTFAEIKSTGVGLVNGEPLTSREVQIRNFLEEVLYLKENKSKLKLLPLDSKAFAKVVQDTLLEEAISLEAQNFNVVQIPAEELKGLEKQASTVLKTVPAWKELQVSQKELESAVRRKAHAKKFVLFRAQSSILPVTDAEALKYFNENRLKFGDLPYENFKENIKGYLSRTQVERRLKDWYDVLLNKYQVKNLIAEI